LLGWRRDTGLPIAAPMSAHDPATGPATGPVTGPATALQTVHQAIAHAAGLASRKPEDVKLIAVSKTQSAEAILPLLAAGQRDFGENRVAEAEGKWPALREAYPDSVLHLIGQLQSNKAEDAVALFDVIHSVDRQSLVTALGKAMERVGKRPACFIQVNIGAEEQKGGCAIHDLPPLLAAAREAGLPIAGLMAIPPADTEAAPYFALLAKLACESGLAGLSMGMSGDFETAVMIGATHVRVGTALFGTRA
jgi:pyridoxal phosphate enzyme (YggS family)